MLSEDGHRIDWRAVSPDLVVQMRAVGMACVAAGADDLPGGDPVTDFHSSG